MAIVDREITEVVCDLCGERTSRTCEICGTDVCIRCRGTITLGHPRLCEVVPDKGCCGKIGPFRLKSSEDLARFTWLLDRRGVDETIVLCPVHYQQIHEELKARLLVAIEAEHEKEVRR